MQSHADRSSPERFSSSSPSQFQFFDIHAVLLHVAKNNHKPHYTPLFQQKQYSLILRKACCEHNLELVELLLKHRDKINLEVNATSTNGNTALDWALNNRDDSNQLQQLMSLLLAAGCKTSDEIAEEQEDALENKSDDEAEEIHGEDKPQWPLECRIL